MDSTAVTVAVTGIVVSGVLGPVITSLVSHVSDARKFARDTARRRRDELRGVLDEAAVLLSAGPRMVRHLTAPGAPGHREAVEWSASVYPMRERLVLRLPANHPVVAAYDRVRDALTALAETALDEESTMRAFEAARDSFLAEARQLLEAPIPERST